MFHLDGCGEMSGCGRRLGGHERFLQIEIEFGASGHADEEAIALDLVRKAIGVALGDRIATIERCVADGVAWLLTKQGVDGFSA